MMHRGLPAWEVPARFVLLYADRMPDIYEREKHRWQWAVAELLADEQEVRKMERKARHGGGRTP